MKMICPFKSGRYCTHIANKNITKNGKRSKCIFSIEKCPHILLITGGKDDIQESK
jgi:hypothetical protein